MYPQSWNNIIALDLETSGSSLKDGCVILSIGMEHLMTSQQFYQEVRYRGFYMEPQGMRVNGLNPLRIDGIATGRRLPLPQVDQNARDWLKKVTGQKKNFKLIAAGLNIAGFDMPFIRKYMGKTAAMFSYRTFDLNAVFFFWDLLKNRGLGSDKKWFRDLMGANTNKHNALADAAEIAVWLRKFGKVNL